MHDMNRCHRTKMWTFISTLKHVCLLCVRAVGARTSSEFAISGHWVLIDLLRLAPKPEQRQQHPILKWRSDFYKSITSVTHFAHDSNKYYSLSSKWTTIRTFAASWSWCATNSRKNKKRKTKWQLQFSLFSKVHVKSIVPIPSEFQY